MSWNIAKRVAKKKADKALNIFKKTPERVDKDVPLRLRIGSGVSINATTFLLAGEDLYVENPGKDNVVTAIGMIDFNDHKIYRAYLENQKGDESCLQVVYDPKEDSIEQVSIFSTVEEMYPQDDDEWKEWLGEEGHIGITPFFTPDDVEFDRVWSEGPEKVSPESFEEVIYTDPYGEEGVKINHQTMLYAREVENDFVEELLVSAEEEEDGAHVRIACGLVISYEAVEVV